MVSVRKTEWKASLFPKDGRYPVPIRMSAQKAEKLMDGKTVTMRIEIRL